MNLSDLLTPWITLAAILVPLVYAEKWIHSHLYGVGWLLTKDDKSATALYYVLLFPGVFLHEFTQYLVAGALNVKIKRIIRWPEAQKDGTLRLDFVQIQKAGWLQAAIIGAAPLVTGLALVWVISSQVLSLDQVVAAIQARDSARLQTALSTLATTPDFFLWLYLVFAISNAMLPTPKDRQGWPLLLVMFVVVIGVLILIGVGDVLYETATGSLANSVNNVTTAFAIVLVVELPGIIFIGFLEEVLERLTRRKFQYGRAKPAAPTGPAQRVPGSNLPLAPGAPLPSLYNIHLPVPEPPKHARRPAAATPKPASSSPPTTASAATRTLPEPTNQPERRARPADTPQTPRSPSRTPDRPPDDRRAQPASPPPAAPLAPQSPRTPDDRRAQPDSPIEGRPPFTRSSQTSHTPPRERTPDAQSDSPTEGRPPFARTSRTAPLTPQSPRPAPVSPRDEPPADAMDQTQRLDQTGRLRRPSPFEDDDEVTYEDDLDMAQDIPDDD